MTQQHLIDRSAGSGSQIAIEDEYDGTKYESRDSRQPTRTTFYKSDIDDLDVSDRRKKELRRALRRNEGEDPGETYSKDYADRKQQNRGEWKRRMVTTFSAQLDLTAAQKRRAVHLITDVLTINNFGSYSTEEVILGVINVVAQENDRWIEEEDAFRELMVDVGISKDGHADIDSLKVLRRMVRDNVPSHGV